MAHKKAGGSTALGRDSVSKRLGVKIFGNQAVKKGQLIVRQKGTKYHPGKNVDIGGDSTLYSLADGLVQFQHKMTKRFHGNLRKTKIVNVVPAK
jgi:large subunit ribosomal protein L27